MCPLAQPSDGWLAPRKSPRRAPMTLTLNPEAIDLATLRQLWAGAPAKFDDGQPNPHLRRGGVGRADRRQRRDGLRRQHRLRTARQYAHSRRSPRRAATQPHPVAQRRARRSAAASRHAADDRSQATRLGARLFGRATAGYRRAPCAARPRCDAGDPGPRQRRRKRGPRATRASDRCADGLRQHRCRRRGDARRRGAPEARHGATAARPQGRAGADQRHAGLDRHRSRRAVHRRAGVRRRDLRRRALGRCAEGQHQTLRSAHFRAARPARPDPRRRRDPRSPRGQRHRRQSRALRPGAGPLQLPLPAAGHGRGARPARKRRADTDHRSGRGDRQSDRLS